MEPIKDFGSLMEKFRSMPKPKRVAVVCPDDEPSVEMLEHCLAQQLASFLLITKGDGAEHAQKFASRYPDAVTVYEMSDVDEAAAKGVELVREGHADVLMKGNINTDNLLRAVLNRDCGLLPQGQVMSHVTVTEIPEFNRLLIFSDAAVIPAPNYDQLLSMIAYDAEVAHALGIEVPRVALIHFSEKVNPKFSHTTDYLRLKELAANGGLGNVEIDGPMDVKSACDAHSAAIKGMASAVTGHADVLIFPNLEAGNTFYKTISCFCKARMAGVLTGTSAPVVIPSRADAPESKLYSMALACVMAGK
ncbi:MAG: phosphate butyryltransferase [Muribaculaceae bacterium]|nr:phosphate butyryltransferase [Muribaculaceae bacterium]